MQLLRLPEVLKIIPVGKTTWYGMIKENRAPAPIRLGPRTVAWLKEDIEKYIQQLAHDQSGS